MLKSREERLAARLIAKKKLSPPIAIYELAGEYADIEEMSLPWATDGITLNLKVSYKKPKIIINSDFPSRRRRFTLAHELGHVVIPWHVGTIVDETNLDYCDNEYCHYESEANRFAAELLMPTEWVKDVITALGNPSKILEAIVRTADVSPLAAIIKLFGILPPGYVYAQVDDSLEVLSAGKSKSTLLDTPRWGSRLQTTHFYGEDAKTSSISIDGYNYLFWEMKHDLMCPTAADGRTWREILDDIVEDIGISGSDASALKKSFNGTIAYANSVVVGEGRNPSSLYSACLIKLKSKKIFDDIVNHEHFDAFMAQKIPDLLAKSKNK